jgi:phosphopantothenoylcysteine decarboxylase/phosphopantothenate--cysteine ligase
MSKKEKLNFLITSGPTREPIDPVRFISNYSTGYLGHQLAEALKKRHHRVRLISGAPKKENNPKLKPILINTARDMLKQVKANLSWADCLIMSAAVSDFRPKKTLAKKIKKTGSMSEIKLIKNPDILKNIKKGKGNKIFIGFALETNNVCKNAKSKLKDKGLDLIVANQIKAKKSAFGEVKNTYYIIDKSFNISILRNISKKRLASHLIDKSIKLWYTNNR